MSFAPYLQTFIPRVRSHFVLVGLENERIMFETCSSTKPNIKKSDKWNRLFYEDDNNPTKFVYNYSTNKHDKLWVKLNA